MFCSLHRTSSATAAEESYTLEADAEVLYLGRKGNTAANITLLTVTQPTAVEAVAEAKSEAKKAVKVITANGIQIGNYNIAGQQVK